MRSRSLDVVMSFRCDICIRKCKPTTHNSFFSFSVHYIIQIDSFSSSHGIVMRHDDQYRIHILYMYKLNIKRIWSSLMTKYHKSIKRRIQNGTDKFTARKNSIFSVTTYGQKSSLERYSRWHSLSNISKTVCENCKICLPSQTYRYCKKSIFLPFLSDKYILCFRNLGESWSFDRLINWYRWILTSDFLCFFRSCNLMVHDIIFEHIHIYKVGPNRNS